VEWSTFRGSCDSPTAKGRSVSARLRRTLGRLCTVGALLTAGVVPADAQIYSWRDDNGNLVLSNKPRDGAAPATSYAVPKADTIRATRYVPAARSQRWDDVIVEHSREQGVRPDLVRAVVQVESAYNPNAVSPKGAQGLMQLMPATARELGVRNVFNPIENIRAGIMYLRRLLDRYNNDEVLALAAYNAGPTAVDKYGEKVPPYRETRDYVTKVNKIAGEAAARIPATRIYKSAELTADGRVIPVYTDKKPK
jgi:soluble lytic murein transglycosylase-like protein